MGLTDPFKMGIDEMVLDKKIDVEIKLAEGDQLNFTTQCCCCAQSFFYGYPQCCGVSADESCCCSSKTGFLCLQFLPETKAMQSGKSFFMCMDYTTEKGVCSEAVDELICCFCMRGASKMWFGGCGDCGPMDPLLVKQSGLCCDYRVALPPSNDTVPLGFACCGMHLCMTSVVSLKQGGGGGGEGEK